jgi:hypothetical protein
MARLRSFWRRLTGWITWKQLGIAGLFITIIAGILAAVYFAAVLPDWTGLPPGAVDAQGNEKPRAKTLWDLLELVIIPVVLLVIGNAISQAQQRSAEKAARLHIQNAALESYLDWMAGLLSDQDSTQLSTKVLRKAKIRTLTTLRRLDGEHNRILIHFLRDAELVTGTSPVIELKKAFLYRVDLQGVNLGGIILQEADLRGVDLTEADLTEADLTGANLKGATVTDEQLLAAKSLKGATMPDGSIHE